jgi:serine/threonine-protein kinase
MRFAVLVLALAGLAHATAVPARAEEATLSLARQARMIREKYCARCHGPNGSARGVFDSIHDRARLITARLLVPGAPDGSELFVRAREGSMPPEGVRLRPSPDEIAVLEKWIQSGAPADEADRIVRTFRGERDILAAIRGQLEKLEPRERPHQRYFTFANLHNSRDVSEPDLRQYRDALSKLLSILSGQRDALVPQTLDADGTVLAVDLRRLGWEKNNRWQELLQQYPFGLSHQDSSDTELRELARAVAKLADPQCELPYLRADWFVATASRPPLYHLLLGVEKDRAIGVLPETIARLAIRYRRELKLEDVACELGLRDAKRLQTQLDGNRKLQELGLTPILQGKTIERQTWDSREGRIKTLFQETAYELGLGTPCIP